MAHQTMRVRGTVSPHPLVILVYSSSTHNFLDPMVARKAGLVINGNANLEVVVANGEKLSSEGRCVNINLTIQGLLITTDFYLLSLGGCDAVLGAYWLCTLGPILWDFSNLWMKFTLNGTSYCFKEEKVQELSFMTGHDIKRIVKGHTRGLLLQLFSAVGNPPSPQPGSQLQRLLGKFCDVF
eukprot:TRINITY_DN6496_c0_g1_i5.p1 TRINITY_DN6496_c0_g1~~TRINITY_DN6496_c0_g1_i5.p1  ORF type:complete len:182 (-),score=20.15 TRINITY_DN6496_c0_g1_i5:3829-4374(-)